MASLQQHSVTVASATTAKLASVGTFFWRWYQDHQDDKVLSVKIPLLGIGLVTVRVRDLHFLFMALFGSEI